MTIGWTNEVTKKAWPRWGVSPTGDRAIFHCQSDIPPGWKLEVPLTPAQLSTQAGGDPRDAQIAEMKAQLDALTALLGSKKAKAAA